MVGITDTEVYFPLYKITRAEIARTWGKPGSAGEKAVAAYDEDTVTMAVAAALGLEKRSEKKVDGLYFATTTAPYGEKQAAALIASAIDLEKECWTVDFANSVRAGTLAMKAAVDAVKSGSAATFTPTCFMQARARAPAIDAPTATSKVTFSLGDHWE